MTPELMRTIITVVKYMIPCIAFIVVLKIKWTDAMASGKTEEDEEQIINRDSFYFKYFDYDTIDDTLRRRGLYYMFPNLNPSSWLAIKFALSFVFLICGISLVNIFFGIAIMLAGFFVPDILVEVNNESDNDKMMDDIKNIFDTLKIQTKAGVFLSLSLCECYLIVEHPRLKAELLNLTNQIITTNNIEDAIACFEKKFDNQYINTLCITILQSMESGKSAQTLEDLSKQIADMQRAINIKLQEKMDRKIQMLQMSLFLVIIVICIYSLATSLASSFIEF